MNDVTPHTGVWIETYRNIHIIGAGSVTPHTGVWIETDVVVSVKSVQHSHAPHGRVD